MLPRFLGQPDLGLCLLDDVGTALSIDADLVVCKEVARLSKMGGLIDFLVEAFRALAPDLCGDRHPFDLDRPTMPSLRTNGKTAKRDSEFALARLPTRL